MISQTTLPSSRPSLRARVQILSLTTALALVTGPALAQDNGIAAFNAYVAGLAALGLDVENGSVNYDEGSDTLTLTDSKLVFAGTISDLPSDDGDDTTTQDLEYSLSMESGTVTITGLTHDAGAFAADTWTYSDDSVLIVTGSVEGEGRLRAEGRMAGISATGYSFTMPEIPAEDPKRQASRWLPFLKATVLTSYEEVKVDSTAMTFEAYAVEDGQETPVVTGTMQMDGYVMADAKDGFIGSYSIDKVTQNLQTLDPSSGNMVNQTTSQGKTIYENIDAAAFVDLFDPDVPVTGDEIVMIGSGSAVDYENTQEILPGMTLKMNIESATMGEMTVTKRDHDFLAVFDELLDTKEPSPEKIITSVFQLYRSFGISDARVSGVSLNVPSPDTDGGFDVNIKEMAMTDVNSDGIGEMMIVGVDAPELPEGASVKLDWAAIGDIEFAEYTPMKAMISTLMADPDYGENNPLEVARAFIPRSFGYEVQGLDVNVPDEGRIQIGKTEFKASTTVPPIPTSLFFKSDGIRAPISAVDDKDVEEMLRALGLEEIVWSDETRLYWDESTLELRLERLMVNVEGVGSAEASARFANVPKALFEDPEGQGQMAAITAQFVDASLVFNDAGITAKGLKHIADAEGIPEDVFREALVAQAAEATRPIQNETFTNMVSEAVSKFLENPGELKVTLAPANPVPLAQILGSMAAPQTIPDLLNVNVTAN
ncbi:hypothetical protein [uncultured Roseibium sp.]|uniref:hypothetical protein n=1 Tax=uncultured Roseibium sp. TaxID=1936171 RepID=UPI002613DD9F|nr:hypothetical protein [uncultured Roseibium sp.]